MIDLLKKKKKVEEVVPQGSTFTPDPSAQPVTQPQPESSNPYLDLLRKRQEDARNEEMITTLAGLATTAMSGDSMGSVADSTTSILDPLTKRRQALEDAELKYQADRQPSAKKASKMFQQTKLELQDKSTGEIKSVFGNYNQGTGEYTDMSGNPLDTQRYNISPAYKFDVKTDPRTGELGRFGQRGMGSAVATKGSQRGAKDFTIRQKNSLDKVGDKLTKSKEYIQASSSLTAAQKAVNMIKLGSPVSDASLLTIFPRMFGEVGNLAYQEQARFSGSPQLQSAWERMKQKYFQTGTLPETDRKDLLEIASIMAEYEKEKIGKLIGRYAGAQSSLGDITLDQAVDYLQNFKPIEVDSAPLIRKGKQVSAKDKSGTKYRYYKGERIAVKWNPKTKRWEQQ